MSRARCALTALVAAMALAAPACSSGGDADTERDREPSATPVGIDATSAATASTVETTEQLPMAVVGLSVLAPVPALELAASGFKDSAAACDTVAIEVVERNARGDIPELTAIADGFLQTEVDLIATVSTPAAQAARQVVSAAGATTPVVFSSVTDPVAAGLIEGPAVHDPWITGSQSLPPLAQVVDAAQEIVPGLDVLGVVHNPNEANSKAVVTALGTIAAERGLVLDVASAVDAGEVGEAAQGLVDRGIDAIVVPPDTTVVSGMEALAQVADTSNLLVIGTDANIARSGAAIGLGADYYGSGFRAGGIACRVLGGEATPADFDVINIGSVGLTVNQTAVAAQGVTIPQHLLELAEIID